MSCFRATIPDAEATSYSCTGRAVVESEGGSTDLSSSLFCRLCFHHKVNFSAIPQPTLGYAYTVLPTDRKNIC